LPVGDESVVDESLDAGETKPSPVANGIDLQKLCGAVGDDARLDNSPIPPASGNISAAVSTPANKQHHANFATALEAGWRSGMRTQ